MHRNDATMKLYINQSMCYNNILLTLYQIPVINDDVFLSVGIFWHKDLKIGVVYLWVGVFWHITINHLSIYRLRHFDITLWIICLFIGWGILTLAIGLVVRSAVDFTVTFRTGFNMKERVFITLTWLSKATVQVRTGTISYMWRIFTNKTISLRMISGVMVCMLASRVRYI